MLHGQVLFVFLCVFVCRFFFFFFPSQKHCCFYFLFSVFVDFSPVLCPTSFVIHLLSHCLGLLSLLRKTTKTDNDRYSNAWMQMARE